jgi:L-threonylcarbamoyladenylate synthase
VDPSIQAAVEVLRRGGLVAFPTETVYGLGADATDPAAVTRIFAVKGRPASHPLIVHLGEAAMVKEWAADVPDTAWALAEAHWPGPLTLVLRRSVEVVPDEVTGGLDTVGLRVPAQPLARELLRAFGGGLAAPSANRFGRVSPTTAEHVRADLGDAVDLVLDGGPCLVGVESTIVDCTHPEPAVLRLGGVTVEALAATLGRPVALGGAEAVRAPGTLPFHYAPRARVEVVEAGWVAERATVLLAGSQRVGLLAPDPGTLGALPEGLDALPAAGGPESYAHCLYDRLREADRRGLDVLLAVPPPPSGLGAAVADRLRRAAGANR